MPCGDVAELDFRALCGRLRVAVILRGPAPAAGVDRVGAVRPDALRAVVTVGDLWCSSVWPMQRSNAYF